jgi:hypothetical protein
MSACRSLCGSGTGWCGGITPCSIRSKVSSEAFLEDDDVGWGEWFLGKTDGGGGGGFLLKARFIMSKPAAKHPSTAKQDRLFSSLFQPLSAFWGLFEALPS